MAALASESLDAPGYHVPFSYKPILADLEGGRYVGPILPASLAELLHKTGGRGGGSGGGATAKKGKPLPRGGRKGTGALRSAPARPVPSVWVELAFHSDGDVPPGPTYCSSVQEMALVWGVLVGMRAETLARPYSPKFRDKRCWYS